MLGLQSNMKTFITKLVDLKFKVILSPMKTQQTVPQGLGRNRMTDRISFIIQLEITVKLSSLRQLTVITVYQVGLSTSQLYITYNLRTTLVTRIPSDVKCVKRDRFLYDRYQNFSLRFWSLSILTTISDTLTSRHSDLTENRSYKRYVKNHVKGRSPPSYT